MIEKIRWGILSSAKIGRTWLIPAIMSSNSSCVHAIGSRSLENAEATAKAFDIPNAYGSYEALLDDPNIDAIYNPLPNHLHVEWTVKAIEAGKHVLCEKPLGVNEQDAKLVLEAAKKHPELKVMEAFMYRFHPQWKKVKEIVDSGALGTLNHVYSAFTFWNRDPNNVRNREALGGGALMDVGCYCISAARFIFGEEPSEVFADMDIDPDFKIDRLTLGTVRFPSGRAQFRCGMQSEPAQMVVISGDKGELQVEMPFYQTPGEPARLKLVQDRKEQVLSVDPCNHYEAQVEAFASAVNQGLPVPTPLTDAVANMKAIDALVESANSQSWVQL